MSTMPPDGFSSPISERALQSALDFHARTTVLEVVRVLRISPDELDGYVLFTYHAISQSETGFPSIAVACWDGTRYLNSRTCPPSFVDLLAGWVALCPIIQRLPQSYRDDLELVICKQPPASPRLALEVSRAAWSLLDLARGIRTWGASIASQQTQPAPTLANYTAPLSSLTFPPAHNTWRPQYDLRSSARQNSAPLLRTNPPSYYPYRFSWTSISESSKTTSARSDELSLYSSTKADDPTNDIADVISSRMTILEMISYLTRHGCANLSRQLDLESCNTTATSRGGYGDVYTGRLYSGVRVAIKTVFRTGSNNQEQMHLKRAARELYVWSKCDHPNVLQLLGLANFRGQLAMLSFWMGNGDLTSYVNANPSVDRMVLIHGDLKGANVLVSERGSVKLNDFGNAVLGDPSLQFTTPGSRSMTPRWTAPEMFDDDDGKQSMEADVYALGMTILETFTGEHPYSDKGDMAVIRLIIRKEVPNRPFVEFPLDNGWGDEMWRLLLRCWHKVPATRPTAFEVYDELKDVNSRLERPDY